MTYFVKLKKSHPHGPWALNLFHDLFLVSCAISTQRVEYTHLKDTQGKARLGKHAKMKIVIDFDPGIDEDQPIMITLSHQVDVLAITFTSGNTDLDQVSKNVLKILDICNGTESGPATLIGKVTSRSQLLCD